jgi:hypothetical protein
MSLPERSVRAGVAVAAGTFKTVADHVVPRSLRETHSYQAVIGRFERFLVESVGDVRGLYGDSGIGGGGLLARKGIGNAIELATFAALHVSPVWFLAMAADASRGTRAFLEALTAELRREGLHMDPGAVRTVDGLLEALERALGTGADAVDMPPLDVAALRTTWEAFRSSREPLPEPAELAELFRDLRATAMQTGRSLLSVSSLSGLGAAARRTAGGTARGTRRAGRVAARLLDETLLEDYRRSLADMRATGFDRYARRVVHPYLQAVRRHFDPARRTFTERRLRRARSDRAPE